MVEKDLEIILHVYGLHIAKGIVEAHGGRVWEESEGEGKGSTFIVELPFDNGFVTKGT